MYAVSELVDGKAVHEWVGNIGSRNGITVEEIAVDLGIEGHIVRCGGKAIIVLGCHGHGFCTS